MKYPNNTAFYMALVFVIPIVIVVIVGLSGYLVYRFLFYDYYCKRSIAKTLKEYNIKKTPFQIIQEYHDKKGEKISFKEIRDLEKKYRQHEPDQFLAMYDVIRNSDNDQGRTGI